MNPKLQAAPGERGCCDAAGRLVQMARAPMLRSALIALAVARGEGTRDEITARIEDLIAGGSLIEVGE